MIGQKDFRFRDDLTKPDAGDTIALEILTGPYKNVIFRYVRVSVREKEDDEAVLQFQYELIEMGDHTETQLRKDPRFSQHLGILLNHLILESLESQDNANRENYSEEPHEERGVHAQGSSVSQE
jgi:hypothetical protein